MAVVGLMLGVAYPNLTASLDAVRLKAAADQVGVFWTAARQRAERRQRVVQVSVEPAENRLRAVSAEDDWRDALVFDAGVRIAAPESRQVYMLYPGTPSPRFELLLRDARGETAGVRINVFTGAPESWDGAKP